MFAQDGNPLRRLVVIKRKVAARRSDGENLNLLRPQQATWGIPQARVHQLLLPLIRVPNRDVRGVLGDDRQNISVDVPCESRAETLKNDSLLQLSLPVEDRDGSVASSSSKVTGVESALPYE